MYSPAIYRLTTPFCEHTTLPPRPWTASDTPLPRMRMNIVRNFTWRGRTVSFVLSSVAEIFEVRVPRLQIIKGKLPEKQNETKSETINEENEGDADRRVLRKEIKNWWQSLSDRIQSLVSKFKSGISIDLLTLLQEEKFANDWNKSYHKALPRLPSTDEPYESFEEEDHHPHEGTESGENAPTPKPRPIELPPDGTALQDLKRDTSRQAVTNNADEAEPPREPNLNSNEISPVDTDSLQLLSSLRHTFQRTEQELYVELTRTSVASLNDVRRSFLSSARGATRRLCAWEVKHLKRSPEETTPTRSEPEWFRAGYHAVPGANVIIRENDWGSIIAFTLG